MSGSAVYVSYFCFFFFKQKTAYEMRISDWSSDVCSSDLIGFGRVRIVRAKLAPHLPRHPQQQQAAGEQQADDLEQLRRRQREDDPQHERSEERRVGKEWVSTGRSRWSPYH